MNLLFLYSNPINPTIGGVERVTFTLGNYFEKKGYKVYFLAANDNYLTKDKRQFLLPDLKKINTNRNIDFFTSFIKSNKINVVINQAGKNIDVTKLSFICKSLNVRLISVIHNSILANIYNFSSVQKTKFEAFKVSFILKFIDNSFVKNILLLIYKLKYKNHYKYLCINSDYVLLLSDKYKKELNYIVASDYLKNVIGLPNPLSFQNVESTEKKKELLYVGRIDRSQKQIHILLHIWNQLYKAYPDWSLNIVGDGVDLEFMKSLSIKLNLKNIFFHGYKSPEEFYRNASIYCMTSSYEGLPMTLIESMQFGVVPLCFNSFKSSSDIIDDKINGFIIEPFSVDMYVKKLKYLMSLSLSDLNSYSTNAKVKSKEFSISKIGGKWMDILNKL